MTNEQQAAADKLVSASSAVIQNAERLGDYVDPMVSLPLSVLRDLNNAASEYTDAKLKAGGHLTLADFVVAS